MPEDLKYLTASELVDMLMKHTEYYMSLCRIEGNIHQRKIAQKHIDLIIAEIKTRDGFKELTFNNDISEGDLP